MSSPLFALVAYVRSPLGEFVEKLRREVHPDNPELPAHVTVLPPRPLRGGVDEAEQIIFDICRTVEPFEVGMGDVETFAPITPTVFIRVAHGAYRLRELHDKLNVGAVQFDEPWPYMPHLTIAKLVDAGTARRAAEVSRQRWAAYQDTRRFLVEKLTFVREGANAQDWIDLAPIPLGSRLAPAR